MFYPFEFITYVFNDKYLLESTGYCCSSVNFEIYFLLPVSLMLETKYSQIIFDI